MIIPKPLFTGARVALIAPSGPVPEGRLEPAVASVQALGLEPVVFSVLYHAARLSGRI